MHAAAAPSPPARTRTSSGPSRSTRTSSVNSSSFPATACGATVRMGARLSSALLEVVIHGATTSATHLEEEQDQEKGRGCHRRHQTEPRRVIDVPRNLKAHPHHTDPVEE